MKYFTIGTFLVFVFVISSCNKSQYLAKQTKPKKLTPMEMLQSVKEHYQYQNKLEVKGRGTMDVKANIMGMEQQKSMDISFYFASEPPGKIRFETQNKKGMAMTVSDGNNVLQYISPLNKYTKKQYSILQTGINHLKQELESIHIKSSMARNLARAFNPLTDSIKNILEMVPDTIMMPDSSRRKVAKIKVDYATKKKDLNKSLKKMVKVPTFTIKSAKTYPTTFWIDPNIPVVLRETSGISLKMVLKADSNKSITIKMSRDIFFTSVNLHPHFAASTFTFHPPKGAKKVKNLNILQNLKKRQHQKYKKAYALVGKKAVNFTLPAYHGKTVTLSDLKGKVVMIDFWATWCGPCRDELPSVQNLYENFKNKGLVVLGIDDEKKSTVLPFLKKNNYTFPTLHDADRSVATKYHVNAIPSVFIINRKGKVSSYLLGLHSKKKLLKALMKAGL